MDPLTDLIPLAVLSASLFGSLHCVSMCGGLVVAAAPTHAQVGLYHLGRLIGYMAIGALSGAVGGQLLSGSNQAWAGWLGTLFLSALFIFIGIRLWRGKGAHLPVPQLFVRAFAQVTRYGGFATGLFSVLLPCGWLHSFTLGAAATGSAPRGALFLLAFWIGTLPAMTFAPVAIQKLLRPVATQMPKVAAILMIGAGLGTLGFRAFTLIQGTPEAVECHTPEHLH